MTASAELPSLFDLSPEQDEVCTLPLDGNYLVSGAPGTGKSIVAVHRAQTLAIDDRHPVLLMYNRVLNSYTSTLIDGLGPIGQVNTFHHWMHDLWTSAYRCRPPMSGSDPWAYDWSAVALQVATDPLPDELRRDLVVDEGQDLPLGFYRLWGLLCRTITVLADENQHLRDNNTTLQEIERAIRPDRHVVLRRNQRNSREIAALANHFYCGGPTGIPDLPERSDPPGPQVRAFDSHVQVADAIAAHARRNPRTRIGVAVRTGVQQEQIANVLARRRTPVEIYQSTSRNPGSINFRRPGVKILNYLSIKGLQFDTLFVPGLESITEDVTSATVRMLFYVITSRARHELHLSYLGDSEPPLVQGIPDSLLQRIP